MEEQKTFIKDVVAANELLDIQAQLLNKTINNLERLKREKRELKEVIDNITNNRFDEALNYYRINFEKRINKKSKIYREKIHKLNEEIKELKKQR
ncbi:MAG: hypothetical protein HXM14_02910 [Fusobacterium periodonticum]|jgi:hypothetical protein|nr:hypothetical protein [Fusobacterium periodonticum]